MRLKADEGEMQINSMTSPDFIPCGYPFDQYNYLIKYLGGRNIVKILNFLYMINFRVSSKSTISLLKKGGEL